MTPIYSSVWAIALCVIQPLTTQRSARCKATISCSANSWMIPVVGSLLDSVHLVTDDSDTEWDDSCPGLVETIAQEAEWKAQEVSNDAVQWGVSTMGD
jgi:hypothetical protein